MQPSKQQQIKQQQQLVYPNVVETFEQQKRLFFVDESMYTTRLYEQKVWCRRGSTPYIRGQKQIGFRAIALVAAIDRNGAVVEAQLEDSSIRKEHFVAFLDKLKHHEEDTYVFLDNLSVHRSKVVKDFAAANRIKLIYNAAYSSEYNPIERLFAVCKHKFRKLLLQTPEVKT